jgi:hypothetical protein
MVLLAKHGLCGMIHVNFAFHMLADIIEGLVAAAAIGRTKDSKGRSSYDGDGLNLASFRESSELEFGADDAFLLRTTCKNCGRFIGLSSP